MIKNASEIHDRFLDAAEIQTRVSESAMSTVIELFEGLILKHSQLVSSLNLDFVNIDTSLVVRLYVFKDFVNDVQNDIDRLWIFLEPTV